MAQDRVFENCEGTATPFPPLRLRFRPARLVQDRSYQIAAAHFYAGDHDEGT